MKPQMKTDGRGFLRKKYTFKFSRIRFLSVFICLHLWIFFLFSCQSKTTDLKTLVPAETLVYLETNDLGKTLRALADNKAFQDAAKSKPDFSALDRMPVALAVTGFETSEKQVTAENSVLNFKPHFVAVADTNLWNWQALNFTENRLGEFVNETYGGEVVLNTSDKNGGKYFVWTAKDGRKILAFVVNGRIYFGNDETTLEKCLTVMSGAADSLAKNGKIFERTEKTLAGGFISSDGIAQIANIAGISTAIEATEDEQGRSFIAKTLPEILRNSIKEIVWTASQTEQGIEDKYTINLKPETASVFKETLVSSSQNQTNSAEFLPADVSGVTCYDLQDPQKAWRSVLFAAAAQTDKASGNILVGFSDSLFEPYGITNSESFLSAIDSGIWTAKLDPEGEKNAAVVTVKDAEKVKKSITEINFKKPAEKQFNADFWKSDDGETAAAFVENKLILGDADSVLKCLEARQNGQNFTKNALFGKFSESRAPAVTFGRDSTEKLIEVLSEKKSENLQMTSIFLTETRFNAQGIERRTISPFGLIGKIIEQFDE